MSDNRDALEELLMKHKQSINGETNEQSLGTRISLDEEVDVPEIHHESNEDIYGDNDLSDEIAAEEAAVQEARRVAAEEKINEIKQAEASKPMAPPDSKDPSYLRDVVAFESEKLAIVTNMVQRVVAKYRIISGGVPDGPVPELMIPGRMAVMGELIDLYYKNGEKITNEFEQMVLKNWVMPDGTVAINNINEDGIVVDKTMISTPNEKVNNNDTVEEDDIKKTPETPTINITVEQNTPVTINVDESIVAKTTTTNEVNIHVREVSEQELLTSNIVENSNQEGIISVYDSGINDVPITLPLSGYRCVIRSINWFDFIKLTAPTSNNSVDNELKKWSVIYQHIKNPSIGEFKDFEDFMMKTKYQDRELLMWGLLVATADDEETLSLKCGNPKCGKPIKINYNPRTIVHLDEKLIPAWYHDAATAGVGEDAFKLWEKVNSTRKRYKLPNTGIIVEINEPSAHEFVTVKLPLIQELYKRYRPDSDMTELDPQDPAMAEFDYLSTNALFVSAMTIVRNENNKPKEYRFTNWEDIETIITKSLDAGDSGILLKLIEESRSHVSPISFRVDDINCTVCGKHEEYVPINDIGSTLLFQLSRRLSNTQINLIETV